MKKILIALALYPTVACGQLKEFTIKGNISGPAPQGKAYFILKTGDTQVVDSANIVNGTFEFKGEIKELAGALMVIDHEGIGNGRLSKQKLVDKLQFFVEPGNLVLTAKDSISKAKITGSKANADYEVFNALIKPLNDKLRAVSMQFISATQEQKKDAAFRDKLHSQSQMLENERKEVVKKFIIQHPRSYICFEALKFFGAQPDPKQVEPLFAGLSTAIKESEYGKAYADKLMKIKSTAIGAVAPDFTQNDMNGKPVKLSSFRGKYVLIDFWASWFVPGREQTMYVAKNYQLYKDRNLAVIGVSLDKDKEAWLKAIQQGKLEWTQVSDLNFFKNAVAVQYNVNALPKNFLIDPEGKIIAVNIRGADIGKKLEEVLKH